MKAITFFATLLLGCAGLAAQNSLPAPGYWGSAGLAAQNSLPAPGYWGSPWYTGYNPTPTVAISPTVNVGNFENQGVTKVIANGYDAMGVWRVLPMVVSYQYNGVQYDVNVLNVWNPWTDQWDKGVDAQAFSTDYMLGNITYDYYVVLSFGTFYFNL